VVAVSLDPDPCMILLMDSFHKKCGQRANTH
jgi:hypothetical protein